MTPRGKARYGSQAWGLVALAIGAWTVPALADLARRKDAIVEVVQKVSPAVVHIGTEHVVNQGPGRRSPLEEFFFGYGGDRPSVTTSLGSLKQDIHELCEAVLESGENWVAIYPNNDEGSGHILSEYESAFKGHPRVRMFPSLRFEAALVLLRHARLVLGNSSMGIREAPYYGTPTVNIGSRQEGRTQNPNIIHVAPERRLVLDAIRRATSLPALRPVREWGHGDSDKRFRRLLERPALWQTPVQKSFNDIPMPPIPQGPRSSEPPVQSR